MTPVISAATQAHCHRSKMCSPCSVRGRPAWRSASDSSLVSAEQPLSSSRLVPSTADRATRRRVPARAWGVADPRTSLSLERSRISAERLAESRPGVAGGAPRRPRVGGRCDVSARDATPGRPAGLPRHRVRPSRCTRPPARSCSAALDQGYADPRRLHGPARDARLLLDNARAVVAEALGVRPDEVTFTASRHRTRCTSGCSACSPGAPRRGDRLRALAPSSTPPCCTRPRWRGRRGGAPPSVPVDRPGRVALDALRRGRRRRRRSRGRRPGRQPRGRHAAAGRRGRAAAPDGVPLFVDACASAGPAAAARRLVRGGRARRTSGAARPASACCWCARAPAGATRSPATTGSTSGPPASRTSPPRWPPPPPCRPSSPSATRSTRGSARWSTGSAPAVAAIPDVEVVGDPVDRLPHLVTFSCLYVDGEALVTELDRRGFAWPAARPAPPRTLEPSHVLAAMGALTHGNVRVSLDPRHHRGRGRAASWPCCPGWSRGCAPRSGVPSDRRPRARLPRDALPAAGHRAGQAPRRGRRSAARSPWSPTTPAARVDVPAWCRMRGQEYVGEDTADDGVPRYVVRRVG